MLEHPQHPAAVGGGARHSLTPQTPEWNMPGYTGFVVGMAETKGGKTPMLAQLEAKAPTPDSFVFSRTCVPPKATHQSLQRDPCNHPEELRKHVGSDNLFPCMQTRAAQDSFKPPCSNIALGDDRINVFNTSYASDYHAPFASQSRIRSPMRNKDLAAAAHSSLKAHYASSFNRVGEKRLAHMMGTMRERLSAKLGNSNDNAFKLRKLFKMYDREHSGMIHYEDFREVTESFGMQLDDDSLLALYCVHDPEGTGFLAYEPIVAQLLDSDLIKLYSDNVDNTQALADALATARLVAALRARINGSAANMRSVFASFEDAGSGGGGGGGGGGLLAPKAFQAACAALGVVLSPMEQTWVDQVAGGAEGHQAGAISWHAFCDALAPQDDA